MAIIICSFPPIAVPVHAASRCSIELEGFRWNSFPLKVLVDMNMWTRSDYALAIREALATWKLSILAYTVSYGGEKLKAVTFSIYVSSVNSTSSYDIFITFCPKNVSPSSSAVGLTTLQWNPVTHEPLSPITINITTWSTTASSLFVKNVAMHELGHALGLGHASSEKTSDGPELMYFMSASERLVYPSTLDIYGLDLLYGSNFNESVQLPSSLPYEMMEPLADIPPQPTFSPSAEPTAMPVTPNPTAQSSLKYITDSILTSLLTCIKQFWEENRLYVAILAVLLLVTIIVLILAPKESG